MLQVVKVGKATDMGESYVTGPDGQVTKLTKMCILTDAAVTNVYVQGTKIFVASRHGIFEIDVGECQTQFEVTPGKPGSKLMAGELIGNWGRVTFLIPDFLSSSLVLKLKTLTLGLPQFCLNGEPRSPSLMPRVKHDSCRLSQ